MNFNSIFLRTLFNLDQGKKKTFQSVNYSYNKNFRIGHNLVISLWLINIHVEIGEGIAMISEKSKQMDLWYLMKPISN